jgi:hypothetical protein
MKTLLWIAVALVASAALVYGVGALLPSGHRATRSVRLPADLPVVYALIADASRYPEWRKDVETVVALAPDRYREEGGFGPITYRVEVDDAPRRRVTRIDDPDLPFGGTWTFELAPEAGGTRLTITEDGVVRSPLFRFFSRFVFGHTKTIDTYLAEATVALQPPSTSL